MAPSGTLLLDSAVPISAAKHATTLVGGVIGGAVVALLWGREPAAHAAERPPMLGTAMGVAAVAFERAHTRAAEDDEENWKRPTPLEPRDAVRAMADAWEQVHGSRPDARVMSVLWAEWALETGRGRWMVDHNFAGLTGRAPEGGSALWWSWEQTESGRRRVRSRFRAYPSFEAGARDYVELVARYPGALAAARRGDAAAFVAALDGKDAFGRKSEAHQREVERLAAEFRASALARPYAEK